jgi:hypothetical protein
MKYEIENDNTVLVFNNDETAPFILQPHYPNGEPFESYEDAENWAKAKVEELSDPDALEAPLGPNLPRKVRPTHTSPLEALANGSGLTVEEFLRRELTALSEQ